MTTPANNSADGALLKREREALHLSQQELADELDVDRSFIAQIETGHRPFPMDRTEDLFRVLTEAKRQREADLRTMRQCMERVTDEDVERELARIRAER